MPMALYSAQGLVAIHRCYTQLYYHTRPEKLRLVNDINPEAGTPKKKKQVLTAVTSSNHGPMLPFPEFPSDT
jgi:hypothetical protein